MQPLLPFLCVLLAIPSAIIVALTTKGEVQGLNRPSLHFMFSRWVRVGFLVFGLITAWLATPLVFSIAFLLRCLWSLLAVANSKKQSFIQHLKKQLSLIYPYLAGLGMLFLIHLS